MRDVMSLVLRCVRDVAEEQMVELPSSLTEDTPLFGRGGLLDSLALVSLVVSVEEAIADEFGRTVSLADERAMSQSRSPFRSVGALADYAAGLVREAA